MTAPLLTPREVTYEAALRGLYGPETRATWEPHASRGLLLADAHVGRSPVSAAVWVRLVDLGFPCVDPLTRTLLARLRAGRTRADAELPRDALHRGPIVYQGGRFKVDPPRVIPPLGEHRRGGLVRLHPLLAEVHEDVCAAGIWPDVAGE